MDEKAWCVSVGVFNGVEVRALCRPIEFIYTKLISSCLYGTLVVSRGTTMLESQRVFPNCQHKVGSTQLAKMMLYPVALGRLWNGTRQSLTHCHCIFWLTSLWCPLVWNSQKQWHEHALSNLLMLHYMFSGSWNTKLAFAALKWLLKGQYAVREGF